MYPVSILLLCATTLTAVFAMFPRKRYEKYTAPLSKEEFNRIPLLPVGFFVQELLVKMGLYKMGQTRNPATRRKAIALFGEIHSPYYLTVLMAEQITNMLLMIWVFSLIGVAAEMDEMAFLGIVIGAAMYAAGRNRLDDMLKEKQKAIQMEFPDFMSRFVLLAGAGMTVAKAWSIAAQSDQRTPLTRELEMVSKDLDLGMNIADTLNAFAWRIKASEVSRFVSAIVQNLELGGENLAVVLNAQVAENWVRRKQTALRLGQEATAKLVFPMVLMFLAVMLCVLAPALMTMGGAF